MIWLQIVAFSMVAATVLHQIGRQEQARRRRFCYTAFAICFTMAITIAFGLQARIDTASPVTGFLLPALLVSAMVCAAALLVATGLRRYTNLTRLPAYVPAFVLALWAICFVALTIAAATYPGS